MLTSFLTLLIFFQLVISPENKTHFVNQYSSLYYNVTNTLFGLKGLSFEQPFKAKPEDTSTRSLGKRSDEKSLSQKTYFLKTEYKSFYRKLFLASLYTWKQNKIFGNGIRSFYTDCHKLAGPYINIDEDEQFNKINLSCSNHPHNYYFQILTTTGIVGLFIMLSIGLLFVVFTFKNFKFIKKFDMTNIILLSAVLSFFLEMFPIKSTGSFYTTNNATYIILIGSIVLSYKERLKVK